MPKLRHGKWFRRWCTALGLIAFVYVIAFPPTLTLALNTPLPPLRVGIIDLLWGAPETAIGGSSQYLTGSVLRKNGKDVNVAVAPATGKPAPHIEYSDPSPVQIPELSVLGKRWVLGKAQLVKGGFGPLAKMFGGLEPTGRKVVELGVDNEAEFKLVLHSINPSKGTVTFQAYVRACIRRPKSKKWLTCTPYAIPTGFFVTFRETDMMPIDINKPAFGFSLTPNVKAQIKQVLSAQNLRQIGIQAAGSIASSVGSGGTGGGSGGTAAPATPPTQSNTSSGVSTGTIMSPLRSPAPMTGFFNEDRGTHRHSGVDLAIPVGTPLYASDSGVAYSLTDPKGYGNFVVIDHGNGYMTLYGHLSSSQVITGQRVSQGQQIALSGNTGRSSGPHLHFELISGATPGNIYSGRPIDPTRLFK
jgi:Peptidase family M23